VALSLSELRVYPVKSCRGLSLEASPVDRFGLQLDRAFMVVGAGDGRFVSQREEPRLALVGVELSAEALTLSAAGKGSVRIGLASLGGARRPVEVWRHRGDGIDQGDAAAGWLSELLGRPLRLVRTPPEHARRVNPERAPEPAWTSFSDGYPFLVLSEASLAALNQRLARPLPMDRFRPNLVVQGSEPHAEDSWRRIRIGALELVLVKPCERCAVTTVNPATGARSGPEPLLTLARYRRSAGAVLFGQNAVARGTGQLAVGMPVEVLETQAPPVFEGAL
jgi:MOSC domain-containing protein